MSALEQLDSVGGAAVINDITDKTMSGVKVHGYTSGIFIIKGKWFEGFTMGKGIKDIANKKDTDKLCLFEFC